jgi:gamma-glutamyltranspeptidase / glutathione hydrolase
MSHEGRQGIQEEGPFFLESSDPENPSPLLFQSRRSPVLSLNGCVASSQPLATQIGLRVLQAGGNAADAAIAVAAALCVTEPCSTGLGGDMFCLHYDASTHKVTAINGSGKSPASLTYERIQQKYRGDPDAYCKSPDSVTVPGAARGWHDLFLRHASNTASFSDLLEPAAQLAERGFPVGPITAHHWREGFGSSIQRYNVNNPLAIQPRAGDVVKNPDLASVLRELGTDGPDAFYKGRIGHAVCEAVQKHGGCLSVEDLTKHAQSDFPEPIGVEYRGCKLWQVPPNGQGIAGLIALEGLKQLEQRGIIPPLTPDSIGKAETYHAMIEMMRLGFADCRAFVADPDHMTVPVDRLLDPERIGSRAQKLFDPTSASVHGIPDASSCTVSFQVVDAGGNAVSFVNSNYMGFGTGIVPDGCGFSLQNRGYGFNIQDPGHPNCVGPAKRPFHTIIPGLLTHSDTGELFATLSNMGGYMQPQGHLQLTVAMVAGRLDPQAAIDLPRFCIADATQHGSVLLEDGADPDQAERLRSGFGHADRLTFPVVGHDRSVFGRAQIIYRDRSTGVLWAGSDGRADGCAMGY